MSSKLQIMLIILSLYTILSCGRDTQVLPSSQKEGEAQIVDTDTDGIPDATLEEQVEEKGTVANATDDKGAPSSSISVGSVQIIVADLITPADDGDTTSCSSECNKITELPDISKYAEIIIFPEPPVEFDSATVSTQYLSNEYNKTEIDGSSGDTPEPALGYLKY